MAQFEQKKLITGKELAQIIGVNCQIIRNYTRRGIIPCYRLGKNVVRYRLEESLNAIRGNAR